MPLHPLFAEVGRRLTRDGLIDIAPWRRRLATLIGAVIVGLVASGFALAGDWAGQTFAGFRDRWHWAPLLVTPAVFVGFTMLTRRFAPQAGGSGIPQVIAASAAPESAAARKLLSLRAAIAKMALTIGALLAGASVGREGPTVQIAAAIMVRVHRLLDVRLSAGVLIAGGAAGVAAAFNTPLAGIAFAIEELAVAYEQRVAVLAMAAVMIAGLTSQGIAGKYVYFGRVHGGLPIASVLLAAPIAGGVGGALGGLFARLLLALRGSGGRWHAPLQHAPIATALICGLIVAGLGLVNDGLTFGTGYGATRSLLTGGAAWLWFGPAKFAATLATSASGIPGGIFAPSLAVGAGFGELLARFFPAGEGGAIVLLGMAGYFVGVVRAPLTAVVILSEATGSSGAILPLFATALVGDWAGAQVCREKLYHALAASFAGPPAGQGAASE